MQDSSPDPEAAAAPRWQPLSAIERRVVGVLVEKAKTTPEAYPLSLNAVTTGGNQKSNRDPQMNLEADQVELAMEHLRKLGAVAEVLGSGRVTKYRHYLYDWLGVDKVELAVMAELLLRGPQSIGQLRGRAARMEPIADVRALQPILQSLMEKKLVMSLTAPGRGQTVTHTLYPEQEMNALAGQYGSTASSSAGGNATQALPAAAQVSAETASLGAPTGEMARSTVQPVAPAAAVPPDVAGQLRVELAELRAEVARLRKEVEDLWANLSQEQTPPE